MGSLVMGALRPFAEQWIDEQLAREPDEIDALLDNLIAYLGAVRSDDSRPILVGTGDSRYVERFDPFDTYDGDSAEIVFLDSVRREGVRSGGDAYGEIDAHETAVSINSSTAADSRSE